MTSKIAELDGNPGANRDPITGTPGAHPVGTGLGAAAGGMAAGALAGTVAGPVGTIAGAVAGAIAGGLAGKGVAEFVDPTVEDAYWRTSYASRPYIAEGASYDDYGPAYRFGVDSYARRNGRTFEQAEPEMMSAWQQSRGLSRLRWEDAVFATRDSWQRLDDSAER